MSSSNAHSRTRRAASLTRLAISGSPTRHSVTCWRRDTKHSQPSAHRCAGACEDCKPNKPLLQRSMHQQCVRILRKPYCLSISHSPHVREVCLEVFARSFVGAAVFSQHHDGIAAIDEVVRHCRESIPLRGEPHEDALEHGTW